MEIIHSDGFERHSKRVNAQGHLFVSFSKTKAWGGNSCASDLGSVLRKTVKSSEEAEGGAVRSVS